MKKLLLTGIILTICAFSCHTSKETSSATSKDAPLCETQWMLTDINCEAIGDSPAKPFIHFSNDGGVTGSLGCNSFFGNYTVNKDKISLEYKGSTKKLCSDMEVEKAFSAALKKDINNYVIVGDVLIIREKNQEVLRFKAAPKNE
jgi:heat shock protein HslJ